MFKSKTEGMSGFLIFLSGPRLNGIAQFEFELGYYVVALE